MEEFSLLKILVLFQDDYYSMLAKGILPRIFYLVEALVRAFVDKTLVRWHLDFFGED